MIPKVIHYCWFGGNPLPEKDKKCLESWKKFCPDYEIKKWDESNYDIHKNAYMEQAYKAQKWGFVPDVARLDIIYTYGGLYFDTDVEIVRSIDILLSEKAFMGFEDDHHVNLGHGFGAEKGNQLIKKCLDEIYTNRNFIDQFGLPDTTPSPLMQTEFLVRHGMIQNNQKQKIEDVSIFPSEYFSPVEFETRAIKTTDNTYSIHWFNASWFEPEEVKTQNNYRKLQDRFGDSIGTALGKPYDYYNRIHASYRKQGIEGIKGLIRRELYKLHINHRGVLGSRSILQLSYAGDCQRLLGHPAERWIFGGAAA